MLRPVEAQLTLYNVEFKAAQVKDPNAAIYQAVQQDEIIKEADKKAHSVQQTPKTEGEVKIREEKERRRQQEEQGKKEKRERKESESEQKADHEGNGFDFYA